MNFLPGGSEWFFLLIVFVLLFGAKRLPDTARSLGRSMRILKAETKGLRDDDDSDDKPAIEDPVAARERREFEEWKATRTDRTETH